MRDRLGFEQMTPKHIKSGDCRGWLRVEIYQLQLRECVNGYYIYVLYRSLGNCSNKWKFSQNYFGIGEGDNKRTNSLGQVIGVTQLHPHNIHKLVGKKLEVRVGVIYKQDEDFINVYRHRALTEGRELRAS